jgi:hypothetical protein
MRLWRPPLRPGEWRSLWLFAAADDGQLEGVLASMPLRVWRTDEVTPLAPPCCGCGGCPARRAHWACGTQGVRRRCRRTVRWCGLSKDHGGGQPLFSRDAAARGGGR